MTDYFYSPRKLEKGNSAVGIALIFIKMVFGLRTLVFGFL
jgi:hypothetical protein